jgi:hypothetical protein
VVDAAVLAAAVASAAPVEPAPLVVGAAPLVDAALLAAIDSPPTSPALASGAAPQAEDNSRTERRRAHIPTYYRLCASARKPPLMPCYDNAARHPRLAAPAIAITLRV